MNYLRSATTPRALLRLAAACALGLALGTAQAATPKVVKKVAPEFPREAMKQSVDSGTVKAKMTIEPDGKVSDVTIVEAQPPRVFDRAVKSALMDWRFEPSGEKQSHEVKLVFSNAD
jgi:protein TonB